MKKPSIIIGKKQIILSCLTLILGIAVYLNYVLADGTSLVTPTTATPGLADTAAHSNDPNAYGAAELVNASANSDYFAQARLEKQTSRDQAVETLQSIIGGGDLSEDELVTNALNAVTVSRQIESESVIESLILAKGFSDCVVYLDHQTAKIVVETDGMEAAEAAAIKEIVLGEAAIPAEGIRIYEVATNAATPPQTP